MKKHRKILVAFCIVAALFLCIPVPKFDVHYATVVTAKDGRLLGARIADDGQWRFPATNSYSEKYMQCVLTYEDRWFFFHPGFNPLSFAEAAVENIRAGKIVRGGSTVSMQVVRLARGNKERTFMEKIIEVTLAVRLELKYSKQEIFSLYAANAPFGGNIVGVDAAAWRYFNTTPDRLTWAEAATLAVLPNSPALVHPGKNRDILKEKRDALLKKMLVSKPHLPKRYGKANIFTEDDCELALLEPMPPKPFALPMSAYHYVSSIEKTHKGQHYRSNIDFELQQSINKLVSKHYKTNSANGIENCGVYVIDYLNQEIIAYIGNHIDARETAMVDMVMAQRSTGSILKPFLFAACLDEGLLLPTMTLPDIPINISGYTPENYSGEYVGAVSADEALKKSLNTPFVYLIRKYGVQKFHDLLKTLGLSGIVFPAEHYGASIILGGAEASLYDIVNAYGMMGLKLSKKQCNDFINNKITVPFSETSIQQVFNILLDLNRPIGHFGWKYFKSSKKVAWKTGTSFGFKDAWAVGMTGRYAVGVWCGNADGEGRPGLTGINAAAPLLFDVVDCLRDDRDFPENVESSIEVDVCAQSGYPASEYCPDHKKATMPDVEIMTGTCPYHKKIFLDKTRRYQVSADCYNVDEECFEICYSLPPVMEWFYRKHNPVYKTLPPAMSGCRTDNNDIMSFIYPEESVRLTIPVGIKGDRQTVIFEIAHRNPDKAVFWSLNDKYLGKTRHVHQMPIDTKPGKYILRCVDEDGNEIIRKVTVNK